LHVGRGLVVAIARAAEERMLVLGVKIGGVISVVVSIAIATRLLGEELVKRDVRAGLAKGLTEVVVWLDFEVASLEPAAADVLGAAVGRCECPSLWLSE
jgi:hypothetical protein